MILWFAGMAIIAIVGWALAVALGFTARRNTRIIEDVSAEKQQAIEQRNEARTQRGRLNTENADLSEALEKTRILYNNILAQNADLREALQEAKAEIKALKMQTVQIEATPAPVEAPKPRTRGRRERTA